MLDRARSVALRTTVLALLGSLSATPVAPAQSTIDPNFIPGPSNPAPPFPADLVSQPNAKQPLPPVPMPQDRAADSYRIYSLLLPVGELANPGWPRDMWLLSDTTISIVPPDQPCLSVNVDGVDMNPHSAIEVPGERRQDFAEMLEDFDLRCHERLHLTAEAFNLVVPLRLLDQSEQEEFIRLRFDPSGGPDADVITARYKGAPGISRFSEVYFNAHHTLAMVYANGWCGGLCAQSYWQVVELQDGLPWKRLGWRTATVMELGYPRPVKFKALFPRIQI